ncbi:MULTISPECIES: TetR/AcrR family transcriptional regulator [Mycobacterium]|nr:MULTISPECIES: TetR/AcrR family transcriptional regulator [Mycobacterium]
MSNTDANKYVACKQVFSWNDFAMPAKGSVGLTQAERSVESSQRLLAAAIALIAEKGFEKTTAAEIGERAGYSRAMVRARYGTKEALLESLVRTEYEPMFLVAPAPAAHGLATILGQFDHLAAQAAEKPELLTAFFTLCFEAIGPVRMLSPWLRAWLARYRAATNTAFQRGQKDGSIRADLDVELETRKIITYGLGLGFRWTLEPELVDFVAELRQWRDSLEVEYAPPHT